jgi:hypothetical protein
MPFVRSTQEPVLFWKPFFLWPLNTVSAFINSRAGRTGTYYKNWLSKALQKHGNICICTTELLYMLSFQ